MCGALVRVSARHVLQKPPKIAEIAGPGAESLTVPSLSERWGTADSGDFSGFFEKIGIFVFELGERVLGRSQMVSGCVWSVCDALTRVSARSGLQKKSKTTEIARPGAESLTAPLPRR